jgi:hypothetical protein
MKQFVDEGDIASGICKMKPGRKHSVDMIILKTFKNHVEII